MTDTATSTRIDHLGQRFTQLAGQLDRPGQGCLAGQVPNPAHLLGDSIDRQG